MAYYGIYSAGVALTASTDADIIRYSFRSANALTANTVYGLEGDDIISIGAQGQTTTARATYAGTTGNAIATGGFLSSTLFGSAGLPVGTTATLIGTGYASGATTLFSTSIQATGVVTSQQGIQTLASTQLWGNQGNDVIALGTKLVALTSSTLGGGAGNDLIGTLQYLSAAAPVVSNFAGAVKFEKAFIEGGGNDDTILLYGTGVDFDISASTIQGGAQNDIVEIGMAGTAIASFFAGGGGDDSLVLQHSGVVTANTIVGGGGNDTISFASNSDVAFNKFFLDTTDLTNTTFDGNDVFTGRISSNGFSSNSIYGGAGNDVISIGEDAAGTLSYSSNLFDLGVGNDTFTANTGHLSNVTILGGAGNDSVVILSSVLASTLNLGAGNDFLQLDNAAAGATTTTIIGGLGADLFSAVDAGSVDQAVRFAYVTATESTLSSMDTIAIGGAAGTQFQFVYSPGSVVVANFTTSSPGGTAIATATNGVVTFLNDGPSDLTSRVAFLDTEITTNGQAVIFNNNLNNRAYLFIQAGSSDLLVQMGTAATVSGATFAVAANGKSFSATIAV